MRATLIIVASLVAAPASPAPLVGADRDAHGCIGSAGYAWCARERHCVRPWELAASRGFANTAKAFKRWCSGRRR